MSDKESLIDFPCDFSLKIIGQNSNDFHTEIKNIVRKHFPDTNDNAIKSKMSKNDKYRAITATVHPTNQAELDALYLELTKHPDIKMVL
ncbi:MAG: DUF493 domain-containing protein [Legionellaceae bacterium]|nr:DUF493 domain-containing protein [Legionellaceae bacterium]